MSLIKVNDIQTTTGTPNRGRILQVVQTSVTAAQTQSGSTTYTDVTNMSVSITPSSASNKVFVMWSLNLCGDTASAEMAFRLARGSTPINIHTGSGTFVTQATWGVGDILSNYTATWAMACWTQSFLDSPTTTSPTTYKLQYGSGWMQGASTLYVNRSASTSSSEGVWGASNMIAMEVAS